MSQEVYLVLFLTSTLYALVLRHWKETLEPDWEVLEVVGGVILTMAGPYWIARHAPQGWTWQQYEQSVVWAFARRTAHHPRPVSAEGGAVELVATIRTRDLATAAALAERYGGSLVVAERAVPEVNLWHVLDVAEVRPSVLARAAEQLRLAYQRLVRV